jgi:hypothetical protein
MTSSHSSSKTRTEGVDMNKSKQKTPFSLFLSLDASSHTQLTSHCECHPLSLQGPN